MDATPILIALLVIGAIWGAYLWPNRSGGRRETPIASTERFDQWTHVMADVQRRGYGNGAGARDGIRQRRRRALLTLVGLSVATLALAVVFRSLNWLLVTLAVDAILAWYVGMLLQVKQREASRLAAIHEEVRPAAAGEPPVRIVAGN